MYFTDDSLLPENQAPLMITAAPYGPVWLPGDCTPEQKLPVTWDEQVQTAVDCFNAGATLLQIHVRDPKNGHISKNFNDYNDQIGRLRSGAENDPATRRVDFFCPRAGGRSKFQNYDSRHKLAEINPKPDQVTVACGTSLYDLTALHPVHDDFAGTRLTNPAMLHAMANLVADSTPDFYLENIKRLVQHGIQPYFALGHVHSLELVSASFVRATTWGR